MLLILDTHAVAYSLTRHTEYIWQTYSRDIRKEKTNWIIIKDLQHTYIRHSLCFGVSCLVAVAGVVAGLTATDWVEEATRDWVDSW